MKKTLLATAIPALLIANAVSATELYSDEVSSFTVGGHISGGLVGSEEGATEVNSVSPRINFGATRDLGNGFTADALVEWSINMEGGEQALSTRLGYVGMTHDTFGRAVVGTQWAPTYDVTGVADMPIAFANDYLYNADMGVMGTGRADDMISYRNGFEFGNNMAINVGVAGQTENTLEDGGDTFNYGKRYQAALSFDIAEYSVGVAHNSGNIYFAGQKETAESTHVSAKYGSYGQGLYVAAVYGQNENAFRAGDIYEETTDMEAIVAYAFANSVNVSINYESVEDDKNKETLFSQSAVQVEYNFAPSVVGYVGYQVDLGSDITSVEDNMWMIGGRIYL